MKRTQMLNFIRCYCCCCCCCGCCYCCCGGILYSMDGALKWERYNIRRFNDQLSMTTWLYITTGFLWFNHFKQTFIANTINTNNSNSSTTHIATMSFYCWQTISFIMNFLFLLLEFIEHCWNWTTFICFSILYF